MKFFLKVETHCWLENNMERTRNIELDLALEKATYGNASLSKKRGNWKNDVLNILSEYFPVHDNSGLYIGSYNRNLCFETPQIILYISSPFFSSRMAITPSTATDFEFGTMCFLFQSGFSSKTTKTMLSLLPLAIHEQPLEIPFSRSKRHIQVIAECVENQKLSGCFLCSESKKPLSQKITEIHLKMDKKKVRAIPKIWTLEDLARYMLSTGQFPTPAQAIKIVRSLEVDKKTFGPSEKIDIDR